MNKQNCYICNSIISEDWLEVSEGCQRYILKSAMMFSKEQQGRQWERSQSNDLLVETIR
jgi:hypothetical protein